MDDWRLSFDLAVPCFDARHLLYRSALGVPAVAIYVVGLPLASLWYICRLPHVHDSKTNALIFLVDIYKEEYPWYFIVVLLRTASIAAVVVVFTSNVVLQLGFILLIIMGAMVIHLRTVPFSLTRSNDLEVCAPETRT